MPLQRLSQLHRRTIAVDFAHGDLKRTLRGSALYSQDPDLGSVLTINVNDDLGDFDVVLREEEFDGEILPGTNSGCDFRISLSVGTACSS